ncbi:MAG: alpha-N-acetylglucosaminidase, partial [Bacteroidaceae bacterium]|nr:alpha-N-acetylglucosaminidase [Bacteroidaceae bacterium]
MKKTFLFSLLLTLLGTLSAWAEFNPEAGKMYALKENTSGLYLDIQTLGINEPGHTTNSMSLNSKLCIIYFEAGAEGKWRLKNVNDTYGGNITNGRHWNTTISETPYDWIIIEEAEKGISIAKDASNYIGWDNGKDITAGSALYNNAEGGNKDAARIYFTLEEYTGKDIKGNGAQATIGVSEINGWAKVPAGTAWTISMDVENPNGASFNEWGTSIFAIGANAFPEKNGYRGLQFYLQSSTNGGKLDAVFDGGDHLIDNVTHKGNFSASISYNGDNLLQIKTTNSSETVAENNYTLSNQLAEFSQLSYGLPTGINVENLLITKLSNNVDYPTAATVSNQKCTFKSGKILYGGDCNKIRFTLTSSDAYYENAKTNKRMSFDSFELFNASGNKVELKDTYFTGNNNGKTFANMLDGENGTFCSGTWGSAEGDDWFEIYLPRTIDLGGAFSFSFVTENTTMNAKAFRIDMSYEAYVNYTFHILGNGSNEVTVTYGEQTLTEGSTIDITDFDVESVSATEIPGYTWSIMVDEENYTITLVYTEAPSVENPAAVVALVNRIGGAGTADKFMFVLDPSLNSKQEVFVIRGDDGKVLVKGSTLSAITTGLGWYLNHIARINIAWNSLNEKTVSGAAYADLSNIPVPTAEEMHTSDAKYRYYLNTCTFGYSMTSWTWKRWQQEIDWMALHGINMPLQLVGLEEVWRKFLTMEEGGKRKYGYTDEAAKAFVAGPAFIAWWAMNNLEGWGGTGSGTKSGGNWAGAGGVQDDAWYVRQKNLAKQITDRQRELGMQPVLPGWSGMVPTNFASKSGYATRANGGNWAGDFVRPLLLSVNNSNYAEIAADYYKCLKEVMGESQYYSMDPFHEGGGAGTMEDYKALYDAMETAKAGSQWVIQQWQWSATQKYSLTAVPAGRLVVLDLFSDGSPAFDNYNGYAPQDAVFCAIPNFGGRSGLMGRLQNVTDNYFKFKGKYASIKGIGAAPEAIEQTPVTYDLIFQLPWMNGVKPNVAEWVDNYA